ncbi:hypothetical protein GJ496_006990 [Pomphorhynchus laevis]|nr:hypothetical protein GJ496_006990 [Pomphorhynchus laevis]
MSNEINPNFGQTTWNSNVNHAMNNVDWTIFEYPDRYLLREDITWISQLGSNFLWNMYWLTKLTYNDTVCAVNIFNAGSRYPPLYCNNQYTSDADFVRRPAYAGKSFFDEENKISNSSNMPVDQFASQFHRNNRLVRNNQFQRQQPLNTIPYSANAINSFNPFLDHRIIDQNRMNTAANEENRLALNLKSCSYLWNKQT